MAQVEGHGNSVAAVAWGLKDRCYAAWSSDPRDAVAAAAELRRFRLTLCEPRPSDAALTEVDALVAWTSGVASLIRGEMPAAAAAFDVAAAHFHKLAQPLHAAQTQVPKIMALTMLGQHDAAACCAVAAQQTLLAHGDVGAASKVALNLGNMLGRSKRFAEALGHFESASTGFASLGDHEHGVMADIGLGDAHAALGRPADAVRTYARALAGAQTGGFLVLQALVQESMALLDLARGRFRDALAGLEHARRVYAELDMPQQLAIVERRVAETYLELRLLPEAIAGVDAVLRRFESLGMEVDRAWALLQRGHALALVGNLGGAVASLALGASLFAQQGNVQGAAAIELARAELALASGNAGESLRRARLAARDFGEAGLVASKLRAQYVVAQALLLLKDHKAARIVFDAVLEQAQQHDLPPTRLYGLTGRAMAARAVGDVQGARQDLEAAAALVQDLGASLPDDGIRSAFQSDHLVVFRELLRLALDDAARADNPATAAAVLVQLERFRARALAERLAGGSADDIDTDIDTDTDTDTDAKIDAQTDVDIRADDSKAAGGQQRDRDDDPATRLVWLQRRQRHLRDDHDAVVSLDAQIRAAEHELLDRARRNRFSATARARAIDSALDTQALQQHLKADEALVEYGVLDDELFAVVVTPSAIVLHRQLASWRRVVEVVRWTRFQLESPAYGGAAMQRHAAALQHRVTHHLRALHGLIWAPLAPALVACRRVLVVPQAPLGSVPFAALNDGQQSLIDRHEIAMVPSARIAMRGLVRGVARGRVRERHHGGHMLALGESSRLPHAQREVQGVSALFSEGRACVGADANVDALRTHGDGAAVIHLACHAQFRADNPMFSAVHLHDGPLTANEIESMQLRCALVVLSACETALHAEHGGDEIFGITRAFLVAGAERVIASLCAVDDAVAARTMLAFYASLNGGASTGAALREAQLAARALAEHPYYWATFVLIGGW